MNNRFFNYLGVLVLASLLILSSCKSMNKTQRGGVVGATTGAAVGAVIGRAAGNTAMGVIIGATVGGTAGILIGRKMDQQAREIENSVPGVKTERVGEGLVVEFNDKILFAFDESKLTEKAKSSLDQLVPILKKYSDTNIEVQGHTDNVGTDKYNMKLSQRRAQAVYSYINSKGIPSSRLKNVAFGEQAPIYTNETEDGRSGNRRVDFAIYANDKMKTDARKDASSN